MAEFSNNAIQTVNPGESIIFTDTPIPCRRGLVRHREGSGEILLSGCIPNTCSTCCCGNSAAEYFAYFGCNVAIPEDGTVGEISVAFAIDGVTFPATTMRATPAAVEEYANVSRATSVPVWRGCCQSFSIRNTSDQPILVQNATVDVNRPDLSSIR